MIGYTKLFQSIVTSTVWQESNDFKALWITMLALRDRDNVCRATVPALAKLNNLTVQDAETIIEKLQQPDPYSRSQDYEGRRVQRVADGWLILNADKYRRKLNQDERRGYLREKQREYRASVNRGVNKRKQLSTLSTQTESETESETDTKKENTPPTPLRGFDAFWHEYPKRVGKGAAERAWRNLKPTQELLAKILDAIKSQKESAQWVKDHGQFIPNPATWLNQKRWEDQLDLIKRGPFDHLG